MRVLLLGWPLSHSLSPRFQNAAFRAAGLGHTYELAPIETLDPAGVRRLLLEPDVLGANVTVPHKEAVLACLDDVTPLGRRAGAVNTVFRRVVGGGGMALVGDNTDVGGFLGDLRAAGLRTAREALDVAVVVGAGGAARGVVVALLGVARELVIVNRTAERARSLAATVVEGQVGGEAEGTVVRVEAWPAKDDEGALREQFGRAGVVVDTTALGLGAKEGEPAFEAALESLCRLPVDALPADTLLYDLKYGGRTPLLALAERLGRRSRDGLGMLVGQGALAFERWTGLRAPLEAMCAAVGLAEAPRLGGGPR